MELCLGVSETTTCNMSKPEDSESDDDFGPMPVAAVAEEHDHDEDDRPKRKKARHLKFESVYVDNMPSADFYEHSFMHRDVVTHIGVSKATEFIITGSHDGHVKFWKKMKSTIEFVKHYHAHLGPIHALVVSTDEKMLVTTSADRMIKFFEISGFDMSNMISVDYVPNAVTWLAGPRNICDRVAVSDMNSGAIRVYKAEGSSEALHTIDLHFSPVRYVQYLPQCSRVP
jgi:peptidylprolyl isomerase domain and WD repeat-containing protein 1